MGAIYSTSLVFAECVIIIIGIRLIMSYIINKYGNDVVQ